MYSVMVCIWERWCEVCKAHECRTGGSAIHASHCTDHFQSLTAAQRGQSRENLRAFCFHKCLCGVRSAHEKGLQNQVALSGTHTQCVVGGIWALAHNSCWNLPTHCSLPCPPDPLGVVMWWDLHSHLEILNSLLHRWISWGCCPCCCEVVGQ